MEKKVLSWGPCWSIWSLLAPLPILSQSFLSLPEMLRLRLLNMATTEKQKHSEEHGIWDHFIKNTLDGSKSMCRKCWQVVSRGSSTSKATSWGNGPLWSHLKVCRAPSCSQTTQLNLQQTFARNTPLQKDGIKAKAITHVIGMMIAVDLRPYSIVENEGFRELLKIWEPWYPNISRKELTQTVLPEIFPDIKQKVKLSLEGSKVGWTLPRTSEYMTVVSHSLGCRKRWAEIFRDKECSVRSGRISGQVRTHTTSEKLFLPRNIDYILIIWNIINLHIAVL